MSLLTAARCGVGIVGISLLIWLRWLNTVLAVCEYISFAK